MKYGIVPQVGAVLLFAMVGLGGESYGQVAAPPPPSAQMGGPAYGQAGPPPPEGQMGEPGRPGALNYVDGQVQANGAAVTARSVGSVALGPGETLETHVGRAEILLTPGVFLRVGNNSTIKMVSPDLTHTEVTLVSGKADIEVDQIYKENQILINQGPTQTRLLKKGLYAFNTTKNTARVFSGEADVYPAGGDGDGDKRVVLKSGHKLVLDGATTKTVPFNKTQSEDGLYAWSSLRSEYLGEANENVASEYAGVAGTNPGWFWDAGFSGYTWLPGEGMLFSPFGFGFYSPYYLEGGGFLYGRRGYGGGYYGRGFARGGFGAVRGGPGGELRGDRGGEFRGGGGGEFHGGGGGFHGGGGHVGGGGGHGGGGHR